VVSPAGTTEQTDNDAHPTEVEAGAYQQSVAMETADEQVPDGASSDIQSEIEAVAENMTSLALSKVASEQLNNHDVTNHDVTNDVTHDVTNDIEVNHEVAGADEAGTEMEYGAESESTTFRRHSPGDSTEPPPPASYHSPESGAFQVIFLSHTQCPLQKLPVMCFIIISMTIKILDGIF